jgi:tol-pal system protein YbgF
MIKRKLFVVALLMGAAFTPARADDVSNRVDQLQQQLQQLVGQVEELNYTVKQLQAQLASAPKQQVGAAETPQVLPLKKKIALAPSLAPQPKITGSANGVESIEQAPLQQDAATTGEPAPGETIYGTNGEQVAAAAPAAKILGAMDNGAAKVGDGGFQGKLIVPPDGADQAAVTDNGSATVETVSAQPETPDDLFLRSEKSLLQLQYGDAENGFKEFLTKYPDHNLAGSAQFKLGETFYAQQQYQDAAQNYLTGYKQYPKSRRAPDSMLKLGLAMNKMGQSQQGCAVLGSVGDEFPNAVEVKKRAQAEFKRAGC